MADDTKNVTPPNRCKITHSRIEVFDLADGGKEFVSPAMREFQLKMSFSIMLVVLGGFRAGLSYPFIQFIGELPFAWARFIAVNFYFGFFGIVVLIVLLLGYLCLDLWLRSSRVIALPGKLQIATHWLFFRRTYIIALSKIIEIKAANNTTANGIYYYDIMVLAEGNGQNWLAALWYPNGIPAVSETFTENDRKVLISGGKTIRAITNIMGKTEANWILEEINKALGRPV